MGGGGRDNIGRSGAGVALGEHCAGGCGWPAVAACRTSVCMNVAARACSICGSCLARAVVFVGLSFGTGDAADVLTFREVLFRDPGLISQDWGKLLAELER